MRALDLALVFCVALAIHAGATQESEFTRDDGGMIAANPRLVVRSWDDCWQLLTTNYWGEHTTTASLWRPVPLATFAVDYQLHGLDADGFHLSSAALHALVSCLVLLLFSRLLPSRIAALAGALLFSVHPVHAEATVGVVGRAEVLALGFTLVAFLLHLRARSGRSWLGYPLASLCFFLAFGSKEIALTGPFLLILVEAAVRRPEVPPEGYRLLRKSASYAGHFVMLGLYFWCRQEVVQAALIPEEGQAIGALALHTRMLTAAQVGWQSLGLLLWPRLSSAHYPFQSPSWSDPLALGVALVHLLALGAGTWAMVRASSLGRVLGLAMLGFYLSMGPVTNIVPIGIVRADRLLYTPSMYVCLLLAVLLVQFRRRTLQLAVIAVLLCWWGVLFVGNAHLWTSNSRLWAATLERYPDAGLAHLGMAEALIDEGEPGLAVQHLQRAIRSDLDRRKGAGARAQLARTLRLLGRADEAPPLIEDALRLDPGCVPAILYQIDLHLEWAEQARDQAERLAQLEQAVELARAASEVAPQEYSVWLILGTTLSRIEGREREAEDTYTRAIAVRASAWRAHFNRSRLRRLVLADLPGALADCRSVVGALEEKAKLSDDELRTLPEAMYYRGLLALRLGFREEGLASLRTLRERFSDYEAATVGAILDGVGQ
ncbi:tetratricopeptide repeat protein [Planctomycetota bacterium]